MRLKTRTGQNTVEYLLMISAVVGVVLAAGAALKHFMPALAGQVTGKVTAAVCTLASDKLELCSSGGDASASGGSESQASSSAAGAASKAAGAISGVVGSFGAGGGGGGGLSPGLGGTVSGGAAPGASGGSFSGGSSPGGGSAGQESSFVQNSQGGMATPSMMGNTPSAGGGGAPLSSPESKSASAGSSQASAGKPPPPGSAGAGLSGSAAAMAGAGASGAASAGTSAGASGAASRGLQLFAASDAASLKDIVAKAAKLTAQALAGDAAAPGELSKLWGRLKRGDLQPPSDQRRQREFERSLSADEKLREAYLNWEKLNAEDRKAALQRAGDDFAKAYSMDSVALVVPSELGDKDAALDEVVHQSAHRYQDGLVAAYSRGELGPDDDRATQAVLLSLNGTYYFAASRGYDAWRGQPMEAHAFLFDGVAWHLKGPHSVLGVVKDPVGDRLRELLGGGDMAQVKKKTALVLAMAFAFALFVGGGLALIFKEQTGGAAAAGARRIEVRVRDDVPAGMKAEVHHVGDISIGPDGGLQLAVFREGKAAAALREAFNAIRKQPSLKVMVEELKTENGKTFKASSWAEVKPDDSRFVWAVVTVLKKDYGFECEVL